MADKQPHLNVAFYGPAVPPAHHGRGCACCLLSTILKIVVALVVAAGILVLILWLVFRPHEIKFHVTDAHLTQFDFAGDQLHYNLALNITIRNPNKRYGVYYDSIEATAVYKDRRVETQWLMPFYQGHKTTTVISSTFDGQQLVLLGGDELAEFDAEKRAGIYGIDVKFRLRLRLKSGEVIGKFKPKVSCELKVPLSPNAYSFTWFQTTACDFDF